MENIRLHGMSTTSLDKVLLWKVIRYSYQFFYFLFYISFYISRYHFYNFLEFHSTLSGKDFRPKFSLFNKFTPSPQPLPLNSQNLLSVVKVFCQFSLKCLLIFFSKIYWQNPAKNFLKVPTTGSPVLFSGHISRTAILTRASVITCKYNF